MATKWLTANEYAEVKHLNPQYVRVLCKEGRIDAEKFGSTWRIPYTETPDVLAEERVSQAVGQIVGACVETIDAAIASLEAMKAAAIQIEES